MRLMFNPLKPEYVVKDWKYLSKVKDVCKQRYSCHFVCILYALYGYGHVNKVTFCLCTYLPIHIFPS